MPITLLLLAMVSVAFADKHDNQITEVISPFGNKTSTNNTASSTANSSVTLDFSIATGDSWDAKDSSNNILLNCLNGKSITAFEYTNITIQTEGGSFFSEAILYFSSSANVDDGLKLTVGTGNENSGTASFSSNGLLDITDSGNLDIISLADDKFNLQFYEHIDDVANAIDARFISGELEIHGVDLVVNNNCPFISSGLLDADLSITHSSEIIGADEIGNTLQITVDVTNNSSDNSAVNVRLNSTLSENLIFTQASCDNNISSADANEIVALTVNDIPANETLQCTFTAEIIELGDYINNLTVLSDNDSNPNNNSVIIFVNGPAAIVVPVNNLLTLLILIFVLFYSVRRTIKT